MVKKSQILVLRWSEKEIGIAFFLLAEFEDTTTTLIVVVVLILLTNSKVSVSPKT